MQDNRTAAERATTEAVAEGVAAKRLGPMESTEINCTELISADSAICQIGSVTCYLSKEEYSQLRHFTRRPIVAQSCKYLVFMCYSCPILHCNGCRRRYLPPEL